MSKQPDKEFKPTPGYQSWVTRDDSDLFFEKRLHGGIRLGGSQLPSYEDLEIPGYPPPEPPEPED